MFLALDTIGFAAVIALTLLLGASNLLEAVLLSMHTSQLIGKIGTDARTTPQLIRLSRLPFAVAGSFLHSPGTVVRAFAFCLYRFPMAVADLFLVQDRPSLLNLLLPTFFDSVLKVRLGDQCS